MAHAAGACRRADALVSERQVRQADAPAQSCSRGEVQDHPIDKAPAWPSPSELPGQRGGRVNVTDEFLYAVEADDFIVSTKNTIFNYTDDEAMARVLIHGGKAKTIWFNCTTEGNLRWRSPDVTDRYGVKLRYPQNDAGGVSLALKARQ